jgi:hypothetical protein
MVAEDLLFWLAPLADALTSDPNLLCRRHADAMVVPRGWTLEDRRDDHPRLFKPNPARADDTQGLKRKRVRSRPSDDQDAQGARPEQLQIDGTGEIERQVDPRHQAPPDYEPWQPDFDANDNLDGLLEVTTPLLARAFRGTDRPRP